MFIGSVVDTFTLPNSLHPYLLSPFSLFFPSWFLILYVCVCALVISAIVFAVYSAYRQPKEREVVSTNYIDSPIIEIENDKRDNEKVPALSDSREK